MDRSTPLKLMLWLIFLIVMGVGLLIFLGGAAAFPGIGPVTPSVDSELRFFAAFWLGYGVFSLWVARDLTTRHQFVPMIILCLLLGVLGRLLSLVTVGQPAGLLINGILAETLNVVLTTVFYVRFRQGLAIER